MNPNKYFARVIGTTEHVYVRLGSIDELLYWRTFEHTSVENIGCGKKFYISPEYAPGYEQWSKLPIWKTQIKEWKQRRDDLLGYNVIT